MALKKSIRLSVRYADDMVIIVKPGIGVQAIESKIATFLKARGMKISKAKTKLTASTSGFDFLGWHFIVLPDGRIRSYPSKASYRKVILKIKSVVKSKIPLIRQKRHARS